MKTVLTPRRRRTVSPLLLLLAAMPAVGAAQEPVLSAWYRGGADGVPQARDLTQLRAIGFSAVTWPLPRDAPATRALLALAERTGLQVILRGQPAPVTPESARQPHAMVDVALDRIRSEMIWPLVWRAVAHGARVVSMADSEGFAALLRGGAAEGQPWRVVVGALGRQFEANGTLFAGSVAGAAVALEPPVVRALDVAVLDAGKGWVLMATNTSADRVQGVARLAPVVPYAMWLNLLDGSTMAMREAADGPRWSFDLEPWAVRIYVIDKTLR